MSGPLLAAALSLQAIGNLYSGFSQAKTMEQEASDIELSANELLFRQSQNEQEMDKRVQGLYGDQMVAVASSGADVSSGAALANYAKLIEDASVAKINSRREARLQAAAMKSSASMQRKQAKKVRAAAILGSAGTVTKGLYDYQQSTGTADTTKNTNASYSDNQLETLNLGD